MSRASGDVPQTEGPGEGVPPRARRDSADDVWLGGDADVGEHTLLLPVVSAYDDRDKGGHAGAERAADPGEADSDEVDDVDEEIDGLIDEAPDDSDAVGDEEYPGASALPGSGGHPIISGYAPGADPEDLGAAPVDALPNAPELGYGRSAADGDDAEQAFLRGLTGRGGGGIDDEDITDRERSEVEQTVFQLRSAAQRLEENLLGGKRVLTRRELAQLAEVSSVSARKLWRALGQPRVPEGEVAFTVRDVDALAKMAGIVDSGLIDEDTALALARAIGQTTDRLVVWEMEALIEYLSDEQGYSETRARQLVLEIFEDLVDPLEDMLLYAWRRNLAGVFGRLNVNVADQLAIGGTPARDASMPLARAVGFIDLVSFTRLSQQLEARELAKLVKDFQLMAYNVVASGGGRVIKTVGDEVFFAAETPSAGAEIAMTLLEQVKADRSLPQARVGFVWGRVLSRLGDIFGTTVNLASRLTAVAHPGSVVTDADTAAIVERAGGFVFGDQRLLSLQGLGETTVVEMRRARGSEPIIFLDD